MFFSMPSCSWIDATKRHALWRFHLRSWRGVCLRMFESMFFYSYIEGRRQRSMRWSNDSHLLNFISFAICCLSNGHWVLDLKNWGSYSNHTAGSSHSGSGFHHWSGNHSGGGSFNHSFGGSFNHSFSHSFNHSWTVTGFNQSHMMTGATKFWNHSFNMSSGSFNMSLNHLDPHSHSSHSSHSSHISLTPIIGAKDVRDSVFWEPFWWLVNLPPPLV